MAKLKIPLVYKTGFEEYSKLSDELKKEFYNLIESAPIGYSPDTLVNYIKDKININEQVLSAITKAIFSLFSLKVQSELPINDLVKEIVIGLKAIKVDNQNLENYFIQLLSIKESINLTIKTMFLTSDRQNILSETRIITDIRPVFGIDEESDILKGTIITHNLKIEYEEDNQTKFIYFALDSDDLNKLKEDIFRAETKEILLKTNFESNSKVIELK